MMQLNQIFLQRSGKALFENTSLTVHPGQRVALVGRNGSGKSTLFQVLLGKLSIDAGDIFLNPSLRIAHMAQEIDATDRPAREYIIDGFVELRHWQQRLMDAEQQHNDTEIVLCHSELDALKAFDIKHKAETIMQGLGFTSADYERKVAEFSGGWRIRLNLARTLLRPSDILLLDEPTNHLDIEAIRFLEQWLKNYQGSLLLISHDRDFIDATTSHIAHIHNKEIKLYTGNYSSFERQRAESLMQQQQLFEKQQEQKQHLESFIRRFKAKASKAKQAQSRVKALEKMHMVSAVRAQSAYHFGIPCSDKISSPLINFSDVSVGYQDNPILKHCDFSILPDMRIGLLGKNGEGKSTLMKTLAKTQAILEGEYISGEHLHIAYFAQHQLEALDLEASALLHLQRLKPKSSEQEIRNFLGSFNLKGDMATEPIKPFSGGEKARLALAIIAWLKPNILLMDEPTNHLDIEMREALGEAIQAFEGAVILVSHDRYLLRHCVEEFWLVEGGKISPFPGDLDDYYQYQNTKGKDSTGSSNKTTSSPSDNKKQQRQQAAQKRQALAPLKKQADKLETKVEVLSTELSEIQEALGEQRLYQDENKQQLQQLMESQAALNQSLTEAEERWMEVLEDYEKKLADD